MIVRQHWMRHWLGVTRHQAITSSNVDSDLWTHMASLGLNELILYNLPCDSHFCIFNFRVNDLIVSVNNVDMTNTDKAQVMQVARSGGKHVNMVSVQFSEICETMFACNIFLNCGIVLRVCTKPASITAMLCAKFQNDLTIEIDVMDKSDFAWFEFNTLRKQNGHHFEMQLFLMKMYEIWFKFHWSLFLGVQSTISQRWLW